MCIRDSHVIDYTHEDFTRGAQRYDVILDNVANRSLRALRRVLAPRGVLLLNSVNGGRVLGPLPRMARGSLLSVFSRQTIRVFSISSTTKDLVALKDLIDGGELTPVIEGAYPLVEAAAALDRVATDHAATTPMHPLAVEALTEQLGRTGNASALHDAGRAARRVVEESRELIAERLGARPTEVVFTGGGTEADNLAVKGLFWARSAADPRRRRVLVSAVEHPAVLDSAAWLAERQGAEAVLLGVDGVGRLDLAALAAELDANGDEVALVSVMWANNEVGTVQPLAEVVELAHRYGIPVHADAVQAVGQLPVDFAASGLDAMTVTGHKVGGPVGVGALLLRRDLGMTPVLHGGGQERGVRSGTLPAALIRSFAVAVDGSVTDRSGHAARVGALRD